VAAKLKTKKMLADRLGSLNQRISDIRNSKKNGNTTDKTAGRTIIQ